MAGGEHRFLISGEWRKSSKKEGIKNPYNNETIAHVYFAEETDLDEAVATSQKAFEITRKLPSYKREEILKNIVKGLDQRAKHKTPKHQNTKTPKHKTQGHKTQNTGTTPIFLLTKHFNL